MSAPLSSKLFGSGVPQGTGTGSHVRDYIAPRGVIGIPQDGPEYAGSAGIYWDQMPAIIAGSSGYSALSTETGVPMGTPAIDSELKVGGGPSQAEVPDYGGTAAY
jgi:hypothetical protein